MLADFVATHPSRGWDESVEREAHRTLLNWVGCAIGASRHPTVEGGAGRRARARPGGAGDDPRPRRARRHGERGAAQRHQLAHVRFRRHASEARSSIPPDRSRPPRWRWPSIAARQAGEFIDALVLGIDVECRIGNVIYPDHYDRGWHITGSTGMLGAAAACARLLGLDARKTAMALGIAASQPIGVREQFGSMTKALHVGGAARAGLMSALMARHGYTASPARLEAPRGLLQTYLDQVRLERNHRRARRAIRDLVQYLQAVRLRHRDPSEHRRLHAAERGAIALRADDIERIDLKVHPLVLELTGKTRAAHRARGEVQRLPRLRGGDHLRGSRRAEFSDEIVVPARCHCAARSHQGERRPGDRRSCGRRDDPVQGRPQLHVFVEHAIGSLERPMSDDDLERKFHGLVDPILGNAHAERVIAQCAAMAGARDVRGLTDAARASKDALAAE